MVTQKMISFKIDANQLDNLDRLCSETGVNRNKLLNFYVLHGNMMLQDVPRLALLSVYQASINCFLDDNKDFKL